MYMLMFLIYLSIILLFMNHPLSLGMILFMQSVLISLVTGMMNLNYWFSYILFLIMIGGMLILFIYMTSIASNEKFKFSFKILFFSMIILILLIMPIFMDKYIFFLNLNNFEMKTNNFDSINYLTMNKFMNYPSYSILMLIIIYLLITLIMVVKITDIKYGPLRQKF